MKSAGWVGYIFEADGKRVYIAGDTDATKEAKAVKCDIALVPIGGYSNDTYVRKLTVCREQNVYTAIIAADAECMEVISDETAE